MEKKLENNRYKKLRGMLHIIAAASDCSYVYVQLVLRGCRTPKTQRASKAHVVLAKAEELLTAINNLTVQNIQR